MSVCCKVMFIAVTSESDKETTADSSVSIMLTLWCAVSEWMNLLLELISGAAKFNKIVLLMRWKREIRK